MYRALNIAKYIIRYCNEKNRTISNLKLQKLLYFVQAEFLVSRGIVCFPEPIEAWDFGPVVPVVYHKYKVYGSASIPYVEKNKVVIFDKKDRRLIDGILEEGSKYSAARLVEITHSQSPWKDAYEPYKGNVITPESILEYFKEK